MLRPTFSLKNSVFSSRRSGLVCEVAQVAQTLLPPPPSSVGRSPARALHCPARSLAGVAARVERGPLMGPGRIHGPDLVCERSTRNVGFDDDNLISSTLTTSLDDVCIFSHLSRLGGMGSATSRLQPLLFPVS